MHVFNIFFRVISNALCKLINGEKCDASMQTVCILSKYFPFIGRRENMYTKIFILQIIQNQMVYSRYFMHDLKFYTYRYIRVYLK